MPKNILKDKNNKVSSKRIIALICFMNALILCWTFVLYGLGNEYLIGLFLLTSIGEGFACACERRS